MKDYSMGFKNRDIDRFSNKFGKQDDPPKKTKKVTPENATPEDKNKIIQGNINRLMKKVADMDRKAEKNNVTKLPAFTEQRKKITDQIITLRSKLK